MRDPNEPAGKMFRFKDCLPPPEKLVLSEETVKLKKEFKYYPDNQNALYQKALDRLNDETDEIISAVEMDKFFRLEKKEVK